MPTTTTKIIDPNNGAGTDYTSLNAWEAARQANLVTGDLIEIALCRCTGGTVDSTSFSIAGWTTGVNNYIKIWCDPTENYWHRGIYKSSGNYYRFQSSGGSDFIISENYVRIENLQIKKTGTTAWDYGILISGTFDAGACDIRIINCYLQGTTGSSRSNHSGIIVTGMTNVSSGKLYVINTISDSFQAPTGYAGFGYYFDESDVTVYCYNSMVVNVNVGFGVYGSTGVLKNCLEYNNTAAGFDLWNGAGNLNNASEDTTADNYGSNCRISQTFTFKAGSYKLAGNDAGARGYGVNLASDANYPVIDDIMHNPRPTTANDIGPFFTRGIKTINGLDIDSVKSINGTPLTSIKTIIGVT